MVAVCLLFSKGICCGLGVVSFWLKAKKQGGKTSKLLLQVGLQADFLENT